MENLFNNQDFLNLAIILLILMTLMLIQGRYCEEKVDSFHSLVLKSFGQMEENNVSPKMENYLLLHDKLGE